MSVRRVLAIAGVLAAVALVGLGGRAMSDGAARPDLGRPVVVDPGNAAAATPVPSAGRGGTQGLPQAEPSSTPRPPARPGAAAPVSPQPPPAAGDDADDRRGHDDADDRQTRGDADDHGDDVTDEAPDPDDEADD